MFKYGVACSLNDVSTTAPIILRGPIEQLCEQAKKIGYDGLEIQLANPLQYDWKHIKEVCGAYGLDLITFATGRSWVRTACACSPTTRRCAGQPLTGSRNISTARRLRAVR